MATSNNRFSAYLTDGERQALKDAAAALGAAENYVVRLALRRSLGLPLEQIHRDQLEYLSTITLTVPVP